MLMIGQIKSNFASIIIYKRKIYIFTPIFIIFAPLITLAFTKLIIMKKL